MKTKVQATGYAELGDVVSRVTRCASASEFGPALEDAFSTHDDEPVYNASKTAYSFRDRDNAEWIVMLCKDNSYYTNCQINYIYAGWMDADQFDKFYESMLAAGFDGIEKPQISLPGPNDGKRKTYRAVLGSYNVHGRLQLRGVIVNPPYPLVADHFKSQSSRPRRRRRFGSLLAALVAGAAVATLVSRLGRNH